jgi:hypothetical protein
MLDVFNGTASDYTTADTFTAIHEASLSGDSDLIAWSKKIRDHVRVLGPKKYPHATEVIRELDEAVTPKEVLAPAVIPEDVSRNPSAGVDAYCRQCGTPIGAGDTYCGKCGAQIGRPSATTSNSTSDGMTRAATSVSDTPAKVNAALGWFVIAALALVIVRDLISARLLTDPATSGVAIILIVGLAYSRFRGHQFGRRWCGAVAIVGAIAFFSEIGLVALGEGGNASYDALALAGALGGISWYRAHRARNLVTASL